MTVENSTRNKIEELAEVIVESPNEDSPKSQGSIMLRRMPESGSMDDGDDPTWLYVRGEGVHRYHEALDALESDKVFEHLTRKELDTELGILAHDLVVNRERMKNGSVRRKRINCFISALARPLIPYEVVFKVERIKFATDPLTIDNVVFRDFSPELAKDWDYARAEGPFREMLQKRLDDLTGQAVGIVGVEAGSVNKAVNRAQEDFDRALNTLRVSISSFPPAVIHDQELLQHRGHFYIIRQLDPEVGQGRPGWERGFQPVDRDLSGPLAQSTKCFIEQLSPLYDNTIQGRLCDALLRSIQWIGTSITRENLDDKIVDLCTALEAALTTKDDKRKGEAIALRSMLLSLALDDGFLSPGELLYFYDLRSRVVHGAALGECGESDYRRLRDRAKDVVLNIIRLTATEKTITRPHRLIDFLESRERMEVAVRWLEAWRDKYTRALAEHAKEKLEEQS